MNPEVKERWLTALRSGEYKQEKGALRLPKGFCCWGVLCDLVDPEGWGPHELGDSAFPHRGEPAIPNVELLRQVGIEEDVAPSNLATLNDTGFSFEAIADVIEKEF